MRVVMSTKEARELGLDLFTFPSMDAALRFACDHLHYFNGAPQAVGVFTEEVAHFDLFHVAVKPLPPIKKFHERIAHGA